jgi:hypothetical protein
MAEKKDIKAGRPSKFTQEIADTICEEIATSSKSLKTICEKEGMPAVRTVLHWLSEGEKTGATEDLKLFLHSYTRARDAQADFLAEEILEIADDGSNDFMTITKGDKTYEVENKEVTNRSRLRVDARKWIASKLKPKKYSERIDLNVDQTIEVVKGFTIEPASRDSKEVTG